MVVWDKQLFWGVVGDGKADFQKYMLVHFLKITTAAISNQKMEKPNFSHFYKVDRLDR